MASLDAKLGISVAGSWLFYLKGGAVLADYHQDTSINFTSTGPGANPGDNQTAEVSQSQLLVGSSIGGGVETMLTDRISAGLEYRFISLSAPTSSSAILSTGSSAIQLHSIRASLDYHF